MAITSNIKNLRIVDGTTLIKQVGPEEKGGEHKLAKWVKTMISFEDFKMLKKLAVDKDISLTALLREIIQQYLTKEKEK